MKDSAPMHLRGSVSRCYVRGDVGYSVSGNDRRPSIDSPNYNPAVDPTTKTWTTPVMGEIGIGCGSGSRGFRADLTLGYYRDRDIDGIKTGYARVSTTPGTFRNQGQHAHGDGQRLLRHGQVP